MSALIRSLYAMNAYLAIERGELEELYHCGMVHQDKFTELNRKDDVLTTLIDSVVSTYQPATGSVEFTYEGNPTADVSFFIGAELAATESAGATSSSFYSSIVGQLNTWLSDNDYLGRAYSTGDKVVVVALLDNETNFSVSIGGFSGDGSIVATEEKDFEGRVETGCMQSRCADGNDALAQTYYDFQTSFINTGCCDEPLQSYPIANNCLEDPDDLSLSVEIENGIFQLSASSSDPLSLGNFTYEITIEDANGETVSGYPLTGTQSTFPATLDPQA